MATERNIPIEKLNGYRDLMIKSIVLGMTPEKQKEWAAKQVYIALGFRNLYLYHNPDVPRNLVI
jgi:hypothetical protein